jgi:histidinol dehydrogenase
MRQFVYPEESKIIISLFNKRGFRFQDERTQMVADIVENVIRNGDLALYKYTEDFDGVRLNNLRVDEEEISRAYQEIDEAFLASLRKAIDNVTRFHRKQLRESWFSFDQGNLTGQLINPLHRVGVYVPGGRAAYPSSVVMTVAPARIAGVDEVVIVTPPDRDGRINPYTLVAARETGVDEIFKVGGAQAIAALASGTESISRVDKIVGPGNIYVTLAKKMVYGLVDIDMLAGPSEILILADDSARPDFLAADLLSQAEHDPLAVSVLITDNPELAEATSTAVSEQLKKLRREGIARKSIEDNALFILVKSIETGMELVNLFAPEHFELVVREPLQYLDQIRNAGAVFIGQYSSEPLGDYLAGPNHVLPTGGTARFASPLNVDDFIKKSSLIYYQKTGLCEVAEDIIRLAELEGLDGHARAIKKRCHENLFKDGVIYDRAEKEDS